MARASRAVVTLEVFVKQRAIFEIRVSLEPLRLAEHRTAAVLIAQKNREDRRDSSAAMSPIHVRPSLREPDGQIVATILGIFVPSPPINTPQFCTSVQHSRTLKDLAPSRKLIPGPINGDPT